VFSEIIELKKERSGKARWKKATARNERSRDVAEVAAAGEAEVEAAVVAGGTATTRRRMNQAGGPPRKTFRCSIFLRARFLLAPRRQQPSPLGWSDPRKRT
jgi:hypothetical protein